MESINIDLIRQILVSGGIQYAGVFGSRARGDFRSDSDVDILVKFREDKIPGLFGFIALENELAVALGMKVDLVTENSVGKFIREEVLRDLKVIYQS